MNFKVIATDFNGTLCENKRAEIRESKQTARQWPSWSIYMETAGLVQMLALKFIPQKMLKRKMCLWNKCFIIENKEGGA